MGRTNKPVKSIVKQMKKRAKVRPDDHVKKIKLLPSPSTLLNCACSDSAFGAFATGRMVNLIGDSSSGKTLFALSCLAEAANSKKFKDYRLIYDDVENANTFNMEYMFGKKMAAKVEAPSITVDDDGKTIDIPSDTIEDFHCNIADALEIGRPFIYILDSFDALDSEQDQDKIEDMRTAKSQGTKPKGSYGMSKPKKSSELLRNICGKLKQGDSLLFIISQTRDDINPRTFTTKTRSGGRALKFYAHHEIWLAMEKKHKSKNRITGANVIAKVSKNKITGKVREVKFPIFYDMGVDDTRSCIDFMVSDGDWTKPTKQTIDTKDLKIRATMAKIIKTIEEGSLERKLVKIVHKAWRDIEESLRLNRKRKYK